MQAMKRKFQNRRKSQGQGVIVEQQQQQTTMMSNDPYMATEPIMTKDINNGIAQEQIPYSSANVGKSSVVSAPVLTGTPTQSRIQHSESDSLYYTEGSQIPLAPPAPAVWSPISSNGSQNAVFTTLINEQNATQLRSAQNSQQLNNSQQLSNSQYITQVDLPIQSIQLNPVVHEDIRQESVEEIQKIYHRERILTEVRQITQPLTDVEYVPVKIEERTLPTETLDTVTNASEGLYADIPASTRTVAPTETQTVMKAPIVEEVEVLQVVEEIVPVIHRQIIVPHIVRIEQPMFEQIYSQPQYSHFQLPQQHFGGQQFGGHQFGGFPFGGHQFGGHQFGGQQFGGQGHQFGGYPYEGHQFGGQQFGGQQFGGQQFGGQQFGGHQFGGQQFGGHQFGGFPFGGQQFGGQQFGGQQFGGQQFGGQQFGGQQFGGQQFGGQQFEQPQHFRYYPSSHHLVSTDRDYENGYNDDDIEYESLLDNDELNDDYENDYDNDDYESGKSKSQGSWVNNDLYDDEDGDFEDDEDDIDYYDVTVYQSQL